jgi:arylsulfatase A-like enzyme
MKDKTNQKIIKLFVFFYLIVFLQACSDYGEKEAVQLAPERPNILLIISDDQGYADISSAGLAADVHTPNIDRIAQAGIRFTQGYATSPICNASRAGLMTGVYQQRFGTYWYGGKGIHEKQYPTIAEALSKSGYATGYVGKFHYGNLSLHGPEFRNFPLNHGYDFFFGNGTPRKHYQIHNRQAEKDFQKTKQRYKKTGQSLQQGPMWLNDKQVDVEGFSTEMYAAQASQFIMGHLDEPFFLTLSFNAVHNFTHQLPREYLEENGLEGYHDWDPAKEDYYEWYKQGRYPNNPEGRAHYLGQLYYLDREIGKVLDLLEQKGLDKNTIILYISDNGGSTPIYADNTPLRGSKYTLYEGGIRVPFLISWPGHILENMTNNRIVSAMDIFPTLCGLTGTDSPSLLDGTDLSEMISGVGPGIDHPLLVWDTGHETAVRMGDWKLKTAKDDAHAKYEMVELELGEFLYNLTDDPGEKTNLADDFPEIVDRLKHAYQEWKITIAPK